MENIKLNISRGIIEIKRFSDNTLIERIRDISSLYSIEDKEISVEYDDITIILLYRNILGVSVNGGSYSAPKSFPELLDQLQRIVGRLPSLYENDNDGVDYDLTQLAADIKKQNFTAVLNQSEFTLPIKPRAIVFFTRNGIEIALNSRFISGYNVIYVPIENNGETIKQNDRIIITYI